MFHCISVMHLVALAASIYGAQGDSLFVLMGAKVKHLQVVLNQFTGKSTFFRISAVLLPLNYLVQKPWVCWQLL